jgi:uncharacterized protein
MKVVLDTNTVISGLFWKGAPRQVLDRARSGEIILFTSLDLLDELADVIGREKFASRLAMADASVEELVIGYASLVTVVRTDKIEPVVKSDPQDDQVLACARSANADVIVSGDNHLLALRQYHGMEIVTAGQLLERL